MVPQRLGTSKEVKSKGEDAGMQEFEQGPRMAVSFFASLLPDREHSSPTDKDFQMLLLERETAACLHHL